MSVIMTLQVAGDSKALEQFAAGNAEMMQRVLGDAKRGGLLAHRFYGSDGGGSLMVLDEWPDRQSFESFFQDHESDLRTLFGVAGVTEQPEPKFWRELGTGDAFGWGA